MGIVSDVIGQIHKGTGAWSRRYQYVDKYEVQQQEKPAIEIHTVV